MFDYPGEKIQKFATITTIVGIIASIAGGIISWALIDDEWGFFVFLGVALAGSFCAYMSGLFLYAFGELCENIASIEDDTSHFHAKDLPKE